jgi:ribosome-associated protein
MSQAEVQRQIVTAVAACEEKKAEEINVLRMEKSSSAFTDYMLICHGTNPRQVQAIADEVELRLKRDSGTYPNQIEGYNQAEWILMDYVDFVLHIFSANARRFYDLERLWRNANRVTVEDLKRVPSRAEEKEAASPTRTRRPSRPKTATSVRAIFAKSATKKSTTKKKSSSVKSAGKKSRSRKES